MPLSMVPPAGQRQRWVNPAADGHVDGWWEVVDKKSQRFVDRLRADNVIIVENQRQRRGQRGQIIDQPGEEHFERRRLRCGQQIQHACAEIGLPRLQSRNQVGEKADGVVVVLVKGEPRHRLVRDGQRQTLYDRFLGFDGGLL